MYGGMIQMDRPGTLAWKREKLSDQLGKADLAACNLFYNANGGSLRALILPGNACNSLGDTAACLKFPDGRRSKSPNQDHGLAMIIIKNNRGRLLVI